MSNLEEFHLEKFLPFVQTESAEEDALLGEEVERAFRDAVNSISDRYGARAPKEKRLAYHNELHTYDVDLRATRILHVINTALQKAGQPGVSKRDRHLVRLAVGHHDKALESKIEERGDGSRVRHRLPDNEQVSSIEVLDYTEEANRRLGRALYTESDRNILSMAILATIPTFENGMVLQRELKQSSPLVAVVVALADLAGVGMEGPECVLKEASALFFENNPDMVDKVLSNGFASMSSEQKEVDRRRILSMFQSQTQFARGRKDAFPHELELLPEAARPAVQELFCNFDPTIEYMDRLVEESEHLPLEALIERIRPGLAIFG